jgi:hypothetical protein
MKKQSRKVGVAGGFMNQMMGNNSSLPEVGKGATILMYSDREAYEVTWVSHDGMSCKIRGMKTTWCGMDYGDEQYTYESDLDSQESLLEWNEKKAKWGRVSYDVEIIKVLAKKLYKEHGYGWGDFLPNGLTYNDIIDGESYGVYTKYKLIEGVTKEYKNFYPVSIIFGMMSQYRDPSF